MSKKDNLKEYAVTKILRTFSESFKPHLCKDFDSCRITVNNDEYKFINGFKIVKSKDIKEFMEQTIYSMTGSSKYNYDSIINNSAVEAVSERLEYDKIRLTASLHCGILFMHPVLIHKSFRYTKAQQEEMLEYGFKNWNKDIWIIDL